MKVKAASTISLALLLFTILSGLLLLSNTIHADNNDSASDTLKVTIDSACTMTGGPTGESTAENIFSATIDPGTYGEIAGSKLTTICNDKDGYAIYAIGYSGDSYDAPDNTKLLGQETISGININTGTTGNDSYWAMKLTTVSGTIPPTIINSFDEYHVVPEVYTPIAKYTSNTSSSASPGATIQTNYKVNISSSQKAGNYQGKVKYTMVHPNTAPEPLTGGRIGVIYDGDGETFQSGSTTNKVIYAPTSSYIANTPEIVKSPNVSDDGTKETAYASDAMVMTPVVADNASRMKVDIKYGLDNNVLLAIIEGNWDGGSPPNNYEILRGQSIDTATFVFDSDAVTFFFLNQSGSAPSSDYDYGFWAQVYPIYSTEQPDTSQSADYPVLSAETGSYATTINWYGSWYANIKNTHYDFLDENEVIKVLSNNASTLKGQTITVKRGLTFNETYAKAGKSQSGGYYIQQDLDYNMCQNVAITHNQTLKDSRDGSTYLVGRLKDGNCWMLDNMALDLTNSTTLANVTEQTTNASNTTLNYLKNGGGTESDKYATSGVSTSDYLNSFSDPFIVLSGNCYHSTECANDPETGKWTKDSIVTHYGPGSGKIGIYYNYCAVSAGSYCYGNGRDAGSPSGNPTEDICPKNWQMPSEWDYENLAHKYTTTDATAISSLQYNLSTPLSGYTVLESSHYQNIEGRFWSTRYHDNGDMGGLGVRPDEMVITNDDRINGWPLRCVISH